MLVHQINYIIALNLCTTINIGRGGERDFTDYILRGITEGEKKKGGKGPRLYATSKC